MKKFKKAWFWFGFLAIVLAACGGGSSAGENGLQSDENQTQGETSSIDELAYQPEAINPQTDICEICAMAVADDQHATQIILKNERALKFDDLGCLFAWIEENGEEDVGAKFVRDFNTNEWILLEEATYVFAEQIETPMAYGIISFKNEEDAQKYIEEQGYGQLLTAADLYDHKWEMMDHDHHHDQGHHHDPGHEHDQQHDQNHGHHGA